jgi:hypothetical protein
MLKKYINEEWNWAILIFMLSKSLLEADGFLETTGYIFHDKGTDLITGQKRTIPIYTQVDDIDVTKPEAYKEIQKKCFESSADGFLIIGQALESIDDDDADDDEFSETIFCRIEHKNKHFISSTQVIHEEDYSTFDLDSLVNFKTYNNQTLPKMYAKILPCNQE